MVSSPFQDDAVPLTAMLSPGPGTWPGAAQTGAELQWKLSSIDSNDFAACNFAMLEPRVRHPPACPSVGEGLNICEASLNDKMPHTCDAITMIDESPVPWKSSRRSRFSLHISVTDATALHMHFQLSTAPL